MRIAALDLGTNSFHLLVAEVGADGHLEPIVREKEMLRLGDVVSRHGVITPSALDAAVTTLRRFRLLAEAAGAGELRACATSAIRQAANGDAAVDRLERETDVDIEVISGLREAELIFRAVRASVFLEPAPAVCLDLGGGSLEVTVGDAGGLRYAMSEPLGVSRLTNAFITTDPISKAERRALRDHVVEILEPVAAEVARFTPRMAVGSSGTLENLAHMVAARRPSDVPSSLNQLMCTREELDALRRDLLASTATERLRMVGLDTRRVDLVTSGSIVLEVAMELFDVDTLTISEWALREGIVLDVADHHDVADWSPDPPAIRRAAVERLASRYGWPEAHSRQVAQLALVLFDGTRELHGLGDVDRELLEYGALLHDVGEHVSSSGHHRHGAYLILNGQIRGFDPAEVQLLAGLARWHRRGDPKPGEELDLVDGERLTKLVALLRIADGLDRGRSGAVESLDVAAGPSLVVLRMTEASDSELEQWGARRKRALFESVFHRDVELAVRPFWRAHGRGSAPHAPGPDDDAAQIQTRR